MPSWTGHIDFVADFVEPAAAFYDTDEDRFCFVGTSEATSPYDAVGVMTIDQADLSPGGIYTTGDGSTPEHTSIGGLHKQNVLYIMDDFWWVGADGDLYKAANYTGYAPSEIFSTYDTLSIHPIRDTIYLIDQHERVLQWNPDTTSFDLFYEPAMDLKLYHCLHYRGDLVMFSRPDDGSLIIYRLDDTEPTHLTQLLRVPSESATFVPAAASAQWGTPWAMHDDRLFFSPGLYWSQDSDAEVAPIWRFDGNSVEVVENVDVPFVPNAWGLVTWRGRLLLYFIRDGDQRIYLYHGGRFTQILDGDYACEDWSDLYSIAGELWLPTLDGAVEGWTRLDAYETGVFTTSWLDVDRPTVQKHLSHLSAVVSDAKDDVAVKIEYRTEGGAWTTAVETEEARHVVATNLGVDFYLLQLRITLTDDSGNDEDLELESIGATYSYGR
jgi:hypothetical protein